MKVGERGQVTIPKEIREQFSITADSEIEFRVEGGEIVIRKMAAPLHLARWKGYCAGRMAELGIGSGDEYVAEVRGR